MRAVEVFARGRGRFATRPTFPLFQNISQYSQMAFKSSPRLGLHLILFHKVFCLFVKVLDFKCRGLQLSDKALCFLDSGRHLLVVEYLHALPIAPPAPVKAAEIHSIPSKSTYYLNGIRRESTLLTQLESNRRNSWCSNWTECEDVKHNYKARASQEQQGLRTFFNCGIGSAAAPKVLDI